MEILKAFFSALIMFGGPAVILWFIMRYFFVTRARKKRLEQIQKDTDAQIERDILKCKLNRLSDHSDSPRIAELAAKKINELMELEISPVAMYKLMENWGLLNDSPIPKSNKEAVMQRWLKESFQKFIDGDSVIHWNHQVCSSVTKENWQKLNDTFLKKCQRSLLVWVPQYQN